MSSPYSRLDRPPLSADRLQSALVRPGALWQQISVVAETGSTNDDLAAAAAELAEGTVLVAESQVAGRGRAGRTWTAPPRAGITVSVLLRPPEPTRPSWGWLALLAGLSAAVALSRITGTDVGLKWPNDLLAGPDERKLGGILAQVVGTAVIVGIGVNVTASADELPGPEATSLLLQGATCTDRDPLLRAVLREIAVRYAGWCGADGDADRCGLHPAYDAVCRTLGREVDVSLPGGSTLRGDAIGVDGAGRLQVRPADGTPVSVTAADVVHVRLAGQ